MSRIEPQAELTAQGSSQGSLPGPPLPEAPPFPVVLSPWGLSVGLSAVE